LHNASGGGRKSKVHRYRLVVIVKKKMDRQGAYKDYEKIPSSEKDLNILVKDTGIIRNVRIEGKHVIPGGLYDEKLSELKTELSVATF
jgi:hypothetical protein